MDLPKQINGWQYFKDAIPNAGQQIIIAWPNSNHNPELRIWLPHAKYNDSIIWLPLQPYKKLESKTAYHPLK